MQPAALLLLLAAVGVRPDNLWGGVQGKEPQAAATQFAAQPAEYHVEPQYQEVPAGQYQEVAAGQYQETHEYQAAESEYPSHPEQHLGQEVAVHAASYQVQPAGPPQYQAAQRRSDAGPPPAQYQPATPQQLHQPVAGAFVPPPGAYPAPPGSFPTQARHPPPAGPSDLLAAPSRAQARVELAPRRPRLGLLPALFARIRRRLSGASSSLAERRSQVKGLFTRARDVVSLLISIPISLISLLYQIPIMLILSLSCLSAPGPPGLCFAG
jgi:hypothetical protein